MLAFFATYLAARGEYYGDRRPAGAGAGHDTGIRCQCGLLSAAQVGGARRCPRSGRPSTCSCQVPSACRLPPAEVPAPDPGTPAGRSAGTIHAVCTLVMDIEAATATTPSSASGYKWHAPRRGARPRRRRRRPRRWRHHRHLQIRHPHLAGARCTRRAPRRMLCDDCSGLLDAAVPRPGRRPLLPDCCWSPAPSAAPSRRQSPCCLVRSGIMPRHRCLRRIDDLRHILSA